MFAMNRSSVLLVLFVAACATATPPAGSALDAAGNVPPARKESVITYDELHDPDILKMDALRALQHLRPMYFRGSAPASFTDVSAGRVQFSVDLGPLQPVGQLSSYNTLTFVEVRYLETGEAQMHFGLSANSGPVILLLTHK
jgi:hypothetical protein